MHIGIDTVKLGGKHFTYLVNEGDKVKKGQPLIRFELEAIKSEGYPCLLYTSSGVLPTEVAISPT